MPAFLCVLAAPLALLAQEPPEAARLYEHATQIRKQATPAARRDALAEFERAARLAHSADPVAEYRALTSAGQLADQLGEPKRSLDDFSRALPLTRAAADRHWEALALHGMGNVQSRLGEAQRALDDFRAELPLRRALGERFEEAIALNNLGAMQWSLGDSREALDDYSQALALRRALNDKIGMAYTLYGIGACYWSMGESQKALEAYAQTIPMWKEANDRHGEANALNSIGLVYATLGDSRKALEYYRQALPIWTSLRDKAGEGYTRNNSGMVHAALGELRMALADYQRARALLEEAGDRRGQAYALHNIGNAHGDLHDDRVALGFYRRSLDLKRALGDRFGEAYTLHNMGECYLSLGDTNKAGELFRQALELRRAISDRSGETATLASLARLESRQDRLESARADIEEALRGIESARSELVNQDLRVTYFASQRRYYEFYVDLLMRLHRRHPDAGFAAQALEASERMRARGLLQSLGEARARIRQGVPAGLLAEEREVQSRINAQADLLSRLNAAPAAEGRQAAARKQLEAALASYDDVRARIRVASPRYASLTEPRPLDLKGIQRDVLGPDDLLLEYSLGDSQSFVWAVTRDSVRSFPLAPRAAIEDAARRLYLAMASRNTASPGETASHARTLTHLLLDPVAASLGTRRLLIAPDGALYYVAFAALPEPGLGEAPLAARHEIVGLPSASVVAELRRDLASRTPRPKLLAVLADPVYQSDDPRVLAPLAPAAASSAFPRLRFSRREAEDILTLAPAAASWSALDFDATRAAVETGRLDRFQLVHFATHAVIDDEHPPLSGIVLSLVGKDGKPQDGFLRLHEIYNLKLNARLVVLSACRTALGQEIRGEGMVGLTRGFLYAGAAGVLSSLWNVEDRATAAFMRFFYQALLQRRLSPAAALAAARNSLRADPRWEAPYYWAAFTVQGEWR